MLVSPPVLLLMQSKVARITILCIQNNTWCNYLMLCTVHIPITIDALTM